MAETIPEHIPALAASPSRDMDTADYEAHYDDAEYPFAQGVVNGAKCCSRCGATKTPQWREGPFGPKTLCNACGVKRTRKLRAEQEGAKRRKTGGSASPVPAKHAAYAKLPPKAPSYSPEPMDSYGSAGLDQYEHYTFAVLPALATAPSLTTSAGRGRPTRRAAEEAAVRTALYARTGEWAAREGGDALTAGDEPLPSLFAAAAGAPHGAETPTSSSDYSLPSSDCPEEVSWTPVAAAGSGPVDLDCYAAVNLMTMSARQAAEATPAPPAAAAASPSVSIGQTHDVEQINHDALVALLAKFVAEPAPHHKVAPVDLAELYKCLPPNKVVELVRLNQDLDHSVHDAHAANAAVAAVAQVLATKQAAALRAREAASNATKRLRRFMAELDTQFGIQSKFAAKARGSPKRPAPLPCPRC
ncbi:hypothetical protein N2152v2_003783 [Parachlorella kessleri]